MMICSQSPTAHKGKKIVKITNFEGGEYIDDLDMIDSLVLHFDDGTCLALATDCRGRDCYISQYAHKPEREK